MTDVSALTTMTASGCAPCDALATDAPALTPAPDPVTPTQNADPMPVTSAFWEGCIGVEGQLTGDGRYIEPGALTWQTPMPLRYVSSDVGAHDGAQVVGRILTVNRHPNGAIWGTGDFDMASPAGIEAERQVREGLTTGVSMDLDNVSFEVRVASELVAQLDPNAKLAAAPASPPVVNPDGTVTVATIGAADEIRATLSAGIRAATIVAIPAFAQAQLHSTPSAPLAAYAAPGGPQGPGPDSGPPTALPPAGVMPDGSPCSMDTTDPAYDPDCACEGMEPPGEPVEGPGEPMPPMATSGPMDAMDDAQAGLMPDGVTACSLDPAQPGYDPKCVVTTPAKTAGPAKGVNPFPAKAATDATTLAGNPATHVGPERKLIDWYVHGEGATKIGWGTDGDFERCRALAGKHVPPTQVSGFCANRHKEATGEWPGPNAHKGGKHSGASEEDTILASGIPMTPPAEWFANPHFKMASPMTITQDGRLFGHLAAWGVCHIGMSHQGCVTAPKSRSNYAYFHTGSIVTAENAEVPVGHITLDTTHAPTTGLSAAGAQNHYERTGHVVADVVAGEDSHGIWVSGALRPGVTAAQVRELRAAPLSGDWRRVSGALELVAALAVNVPGFPIPRPKGLVAGGVVQSLVASGMIPPRTVITPGMDGAFSMDDLKYLKRLADRERAEEAQLAALGTLPSAVELARRVRASSLAMRAHSFRTSPRG